MVQNSLPKLFEIKDKASLMHKLDERVNVSEINVAKQIGLESRRMQIPKVYVHALSAREQKRESVFDSATRSLFLKQIP